jgi:3-methyladenine DNA glycosylase/8-oxoguanine DNA glycosylase
MVEEVKHLVDQAVQEVEVVQDQVVQVQEQEILHQLVQVKVIMEAPELIVLGQVAVVVPEHQEQMQVH